jgi:NAD(P)-dependent dehydrogenase (short-subunit alcohol dehydrogenase family)
VWDKIFDVNVKSSFFLAKEALPHMEKRGKASIIFNSSILGYIPNCGVNPLGYLLEIWLQYFNFFWGMFRLSLWGLTR